MSSNESITYLGIGNMGTAIVSALLKAGRTVTIWNRTAERPFVKKNIEQGAVFKADLAAAIAEGQIIVATLLDYDSINKALSGLPSGTLNGKTFVNITNGTPKEANEMQAWLRARGIAHYVDGAIMVPPPMVGGPQSFFVLSGEDADFVTSTIAPALAPAGITHYMGPEVSAAARYDVSALAAMYGMLSGGYLATALLKKGTSDGKVAPMTKESIVPMVTALVPLIAQEAEFWDDGKYDEHGGSPIGMQLHSVRKIIEAAKDEGIDAGVLEHLAGLHARIVEDHGPNGGTTRVGPYLMK